MLRLPAIDNTRACFALASASTVLTGSTVATGVATATAEKPDTIGQPTIAALPTMPQPTMPQPTMPSGLPLHPVASPASLPQVFCYLASDLANCPASFDLVTDGRNGGSASLAEILMFLLGPEVENLEGAFSTAVPDVGAILGIVRPAAVAGAQRRLRAKLADIGMKVNDDYCRPSDWSSEAKSIALKALDCEVAWLKTITNDPPTAQISAVIPLLLMDVSCNYALKRAGMLGIRGQSYLTELGQLGFAQQEVLAARLHFFLCQAYSWFYQALLSADTLPAGFSVSESVAADIVATAELVEQIRVAFRHVDGALKVHERRYWDDNGNAKVRASRSSYTDSKVSSAKFVFLVKKKKRLEEIARPCSGLSLEAVSEIARIAASPDGESEENLKRIFDVLSDPYLRCKEGIRSVRDWESRHAFGYALRGQPLRAAVDGVEFTGVRQRDAVEKVLNGRLELMAANVVARVQAANSDRQ